MLSSKFFSPGRRLIVGVSAMIPLLSACSVAEKKTEEPRSIFIVSHEENIDREGSMKLVFGVTPADFIFTPQQLSLCPKSVNDYLKISGVESLGNGKFSASVEDRGCGEAYCLDVTLRIGVSGTQEGEILSDPFVIRYSPREYDFAVLTNETVYDEHNHAAFTGLLDYRGTLYLAFREGASHRPSSTADYGVIKVLARNGSLWKENAVIRDPAKDLRDPFLVKVGGVMRMYIGYNTFEGERYQHSGSVYADYEDGKWSEVKPVRHDVPHIAWLWKVRKYADKYYSVAYLEGEQPVLLRSSDGVDWETVTSFPLEGILSEADMAFVGKTLYVCLRKDQPVGSPSLWGVARDPFEAFTWTEMTTCVESPELLRLPFSNSILLAGRERHPSSSEVSTTLFCCSAAGELSKVATLETGMGCDTGYPGLALKDGSLYCSYYMGKQNAAHIQFSKLSVKQKEI